MARSFPPVAQTVGALVLLLCHLDTFGSDVRGSVGAWGAWHGTSTPASISRITHFRSVNNLRDALQHCSAHIEHADRGEATLCQLRDAAAPIFASSGDVTLIMVHTEDASVVKSP